MTDRTFIPLGIAVLTVSDSRDASQDKSGDLLAAKLEASGHRLAARALVADDLYQIRAQVSTWLIEPDIQVILCTGGTGVTGRDGTPEAVMPLLDKKIDGFGEMFRVLSYESIGTSTLQSRALAGVANGRYLFCLPGSPGACRDAWEKLIEKQLDYRTRPLQPGRTHAAPRRIAQPPRYDMPAFCIRDVSCVRSSE